jgi:branched-chain amino acid transport system substrate-binding protein
MKKAAILFLLTLSACVFAADTRPIFKIGVIAPLTGDNAMLGEDMKNGPALAVEELKGKLPFDIQLVFEDDQLQNQQTLLAAHKLIDWDHVDMLFTIWTPSANLLGPLTDKAHVIDFNTSWDAEPVSKYNWTLMHGPTYQDYADKVVEIIKSSHAKRVAIASNIELGNNKGIAYAEPLIRKLGAKIVFDEKHNSDDVDLRDYFLKLRETKPDFIWHHNNPPGDLIFFRAWNQLGDPMPSTGYLDFMRKGYEDYRKLYEGTVFASALYNTPAFSEKYTKRFGHPSYVRAAFFYDMVNITASAVDTLYKKLGRMPTHEELIVELKKPKELSNLAVGPGRMTPSGWVETHHVLRQIKNGKVVDYKK